jgi:hypothetical protein
MMLMIDVDKRTVEATTAQAETTRNSQSAPCQTVFPAPLSNQSERKQETAAHPCSCSVSVSLPLSSVQSITVRSLPIHRKACLVSDRPFRFFCFFSRMIRGFDGVEYPSVDRGHCVYLVVGVERCRLATSWCSKWNIDKAIRTVLRVQWQIPMRIG